LIATFLYFLPLITIQIEHFLVPGHDGRLILGTWIGLSMGEIMSKWPFSCKIRPSSTNGGKGSPERQKDGRQKYESCREEGPTLRMVHLLAPAKPKRKLSG
jgi:hypothetical protein